jgi:uncharacterized membrane protein
MFNRMEIKQRAKATFLNDYGISIGAYVLFWLVGAAASGITAGLGALLILPPLMVGYSSFVLRIYKGENGDIGDMFTNGFSNYGRNLGGMLFMELFVFLWSLLFVIPGIVKALAYSMTPYILADCPNVRATDAIKLSMRMTRGHKGGIFVMCLSFIGWWLLSAITFGILQLLFVGPYTNTSFAGLYVDLKARALNNGIIRPEELA